MGCGRGGVEGGGLRGRGSGCSESTTTRIVSPGGGGGCLDGLTCEVGTSGAGHPQADGAGGVAIEQGGDGAVDGHGDQVLVEGQLPRLRRDARSAAAARTPPRGAANSRAIAGRCMRARPRPAHLQPRGSTGEGWHASGRGSGCGGGPDRLCR